MIILCQVMLFQRFRELQQMEEFLFNITDEDIQAENFTPEADAEGKVYGWYGVTAENYN